MEIENAVRNLSHRDLTSFRDWFLSFDALAWDLQFKQDVASGRINAHADEAIADLLKSACDARPAGLRLTCVYPHSLDALRDAAPR